MTGTTSPAPAAIGLYRLELIVGSEGTPGAPLLHVHALVDAPTGRISGLAEITQAIAPPDGDLRVNDLTGQIHALGLEPPVRTITLAGHYVYYLPPPAIGEFLLPVSASIVLQEDGNGRGSFHYGENRIHDVPVKTVPS